MVSRGGSVNPLQFPDEEFDLYSIPAFDAGQPEIALGAEIGSTKQIIQPDDVLLSKIVPHIRRAWVVGDYRGRRLIGSGEWIVFRSEKVFPKYLRHVLVGDPFHQQFMQTVSGVGGSLLRARPAFVASIQIPLPPLKEQRRIAAILDQAETLRTQRRTALALLDSLTQSLFFDMFGDPSAEDSKWSQTQLDVVAELVTGYPFRSEEYVGPDEGIKLCRGANVLPGRLDWRDMVCWPHEKVKEAEAFHLRAGDIVMAMDRPWISEGFKLTKVDASDCPMLLVQRVARIRPKSEVTNEYLLAVLSHGAFTRHCKPTETTIPHISPNDIRSFSFPLPPLPLQQTFATRIAAIEALKATHRRALAALDALFASLQQRAFAGQL